MARQLIADPYTVRKMAEGRADEVRLCIGCNDACVAQTAQEKAIRCVHNPAAGRERTHAESRLLRAAELLDVLVVGGGPAGLKTAEVAARCGHRVRLLEAEPELGGLVRLAARQPYRAEIAAVVDHLALVCERVGVELQTGVSAGPDLVAASGADVVVIATGSAPHLPPRPTAAADGWHDDGGVARALGRQAEPPVPGLDAPCVVSVDAVLRGDVTPGERVLVYDGLGSWQAVGTAEYLATWGHRVVLVTGAPMIGALLDYGGRVLFLERATALGLELASGLVLESVEDGRAVLRATHDRREHAFEADTIVPALPRRSREDLYLLLHERLPAGTRLVRVGDCVAPRFLQAVIAEAAELGANLAPAAVEVGATP
jgi:NADPH-dependent 2,4-dienoyl-CoA reductase/sulfur reductase-like enzyme